MKKLIALSFLCLSCAPFRDSPFSDQTLRGESNLNKAAIESLGPIEQDGHIRIAVFADPHQNYKDLDETIVRINQAANIDFVVNLGDVTNSAYNFEFDQFLDAYVLIQKPAMSVIGNHDAIGAGPDIFRRVFGDTNFWFESTSRRFIFFESTNLEDLAGFHPEWLQEAVESSAKPVVIFSHVNLRDSERFSGIDAQIFSSVIENTKTQLILNGHNHIYEIANDHGTLMLQVPRVENVQWILIDIQGNQISIEKMSSGGVVSDTLKH